MSLRLGRILGGHAGASQPGSQMLTQVPVRRYSRARFAAWDRQGMILTPPPGRIYLLRHAKAAWAAPGQRDFDRPLDNQGYDEAEIVAYLAADKGYRPDIVISSTAVRCRETAEAIRRAFPGELEFRFVDQLYNCPTDAYIEIVSALQTFSSIMMVGHNPAIEEFLGLLIGLDTLGETLPEGYPPGGLAVIDQPPEQEEGVKAGWHLRDFLRG